jgi:hypothetical protein
MFTFLEDFMLKEKFQLAAVRHAGGMSLLALTIALSSLFMMARGALGQTGQGSITGRVIDDSNALIPGATVTVTSDSTGVIATTKSNKTGTYDFTALNPGTYTITVNMLGFKREQIQKIIVGAAQVVETNVTLSIGATDATITVTSADSLLSKGTSDVATTVDSTLVQNLPYPERSALEAVLLVPGVNGDPLQPGGISSENGNAFTAAVTPANNISVGGAPPGTTSILIDGSDVTRGSLPSAGLNLSGRVVTETTVITSGMSAQYGRTGAGVIIESSRPGTREYHGAITWRHTDPFFNAIPFASVTPNQIHENYYGFYIGGPIYIPKIYNKRDKTFFFVGVEPLRASNTISSRASLLTPDDLAGRFQNSLPLLNQTILRAQGYAAAVAQPRVGGLFYQTATQDANGFPTGPLLSQQSAYTPIPNNDVSGQLAHNKFAQFLAAQLPTPTNPGPYVKFDNANGTYANDGTNAVVLRGVLNSDNRYSIRIDHQFNNNNQIYVRYTVTPVVASRFFDVASANPINQVPTENTVARDVAIGYTHVFTSNLVNNFHYSFLRVNGQRLPPASAQTQDFAGANGLTPAIVGVGFPSLGNFNSNGVSYGISPGTAGSYVQRDQNFIAGNDITWTRGAHLIHFGADIRWIQSNQYDLSGLTGGKYSFSSNSTNANSSGGLALASLDLGLINSFSNTPVSVPGYYRWHYYAGYIQDDYRATPKLTLNVGLRYELETPRAEKFNNQAFVTTAAGTLVSPLAGYGSTSVNASFCFSGACGQSKYLFPINYKGFEPRLGLAYAVTNRTTVRASYALSRLPLTGYEQLPDPNFNVASGGVGGITGGVIPGQPVDYITNPVGTLTSAYTALNGARGPFYYSTGLAPVFVQQTNTVPDIQTYSLSVQFQPASRTLLQMTYQGTKGTHIIGPFNLAQNTAPIATIQGLIANQTYLGAPAVPNALGIPVATGSSTVATESLLQTFEPYQGFYNQSLPLIYPRNGELHYNAFYASVNQRFGRGLALLANYTWSKSLDNIAENAAIGGGFGVAPPQNPLSTANEYSLSSVDQPSRLRIGYTYDLPFGYQERFRTGIGLLDRLLGNISTSGFGTSSSGFPNYITLGSAGYFTSATPAGVNGCAQITASNKNNFCSTNALPAGYTLRPNLIPGVPLRNPHWKDNPYNSLGVGGITSYINPLLFTPGSPNVAITVPGSPLNAQYGNAPRNLGSLRSPREFFFDARVQKTFAIKDRYRFNLNTTFSNAFNHPVYFGIGGHNLLSSTTINQTVTSAQGAYVNNLNTGFGNLVASQTQSVSRVIRVGAEFNF